MYIQVIITTEREIIKLQYQRIDGREANQTRPIHIETGFMPKAEGSALVKLGDTHVICTATVDHSVPRWLRGNGRGWVTAEYAMLPRSTDDRIDRRRSISSGRSKEIERLIGRSLRSIIDLIALGERSITIDCDVLRADGGTRTASITGAYVALVLALRETPSTANRLDRILTDSVSATSVGIVNGNPLLDLDYQEDSNAEVDMNIVMTGSGDFVEVQGTAEGIPFSHQQLQAMLQLGQQGCIQMNKAQTKVLNI